jgi:hypothetical protein
MKKLLTILFMTCLFQYISSNDFIIVSPDRDLQVSVFSGNGMGMKRCLLTAIPENMSYWRVATGSNGIRKDHLDCSI